MPKKKESPLVTRMKRLYPTLQAHQWSKALNDIFREIYAIVCDQKSLRIGNYGEFYEGTQGSKKVRKENIGGCGEIKTPVMTRLSWRPFRHCKGSTQNWCETEGADRPTDNSSSQSGSDIT